VSSSSDGADSVTLDDVLRIVPASVLIGGLIVFVIVWWILRRR
jgi:hypothetical protein